MSPADLLEEAAQHRRMAAGYREEIADLERLADDADDRAAAAESKFAAASVLEPSEVRRLFRSQLTDEARR